MPIALTIANAAIKAFVTLKLHEKIWYLLKKKHHITLFGTSGSGKSQFINSLVGKIEIPQRTNETNFLKFDIASYAVNFHDTPGGDTGHLDNRTTEIQKMLSGQIEGIINIVSNGYKEIDRIIEFKENVELTNYLNANREDECTRLAQWMPSTRKNNVKWIITLVNKADLWWEEKEKVLEYYENGKYATDIKGYNNTIKHIVLPYCSIIKSFYGFNHSGTFGDMDKQSLKNGFLYQIGTLCGKQK